jgi:hypothetical protein
LSIGDEKHNTTRSYAVFIPKEVSHCPVIWRYIVGTPIFYFANTTTTSYSKENNAKYENKLGFRLNSPSWRNPIVTLVKVKPVMIEWSKASFQLVSDSAYQQFIHRARSISGPIWLR